jgi:hypothetical protein
MIAPQILMPSGMIECAPEHSELASDIAQRRRLIRSSIANQLLRWRKRSARLLASRWR